MRMEGLSMKETSRSETELVAGSGLLHRRMFLTGSAAAIGAGGIVDQAGAAPLPVESWMKIPGAPFNGYGQPSKYEEKVARTWASAPGTGGTGSSRTPHHLLDGMITPSGLHYERSHSGIPDINPDTHRLLIHGLVKRPLVFTLATVARCSPSSRPRRMSRRSMACCHARNGPGSSSRCCYKRPVSTRPPSGCWRKAPTPPA
jgi:sulfane dehydrogenase subunit SoxC